MRPPHRRRRARAAPRRSDRDQGRHRHRGRDDRVRLRRRRSTSIAEDSEVVRRLREAGAVIVGKTTTSEIGQWPFSESLGSGITRNPWNLDHTPAGRAEARRRPSRRSSSPARSAPTARARCASRRRGATWSGSSLSAGASRPGRTPRRFAGLTCLGPLTRTVADAALLLDVVARQPRRRPPPPRSLRPGPIWTLRAREPRRASGSLSRPRSPSAARRRSSIPRSARRPSGWASVLDAARPHGRRGRPRLRPGRRELHAALDERHPRVGRPHRRARRPRSDAPATTRRSESSSRAPLLAAARALERPIRSRIGKIFDRFDVVLAPTTAKPALPIGAAEGLGGWATDKLIVGACPYAWPWNVIGWPGVNVPAGLTDDGLPIGVSAARARRTRRSS